MFNTHPRLSLTQPRLMAIVNATPDSFSDGGMLYQGGKLDNNKLIARLRCIVDEGADIIDIGGESTRPGASPVGTQEEMDRVMPVIEWVAGETDLAISVDTSSPKVMLEAAAKGAHLINDVRALSREGALEAAASTSLAICLMHMQGEPVAKQDAPTYENVFDEVGHYLLQRAKACRKAGIDRERICLDPGFGFGKTVDHNVSLLKQLRELEALGYPLLVGLSRKSMIGRLLGRDVSDRLPASLALAMLSLERGANIIRVHDVRASRDIIDTYIAVSSAP